MPPARWDRWLENFRARHGATVRTGNTWTAADGARAQVGAPFAPRVAELRPGRLRVGVLLVRLGGYAAGIFEDDESGARLVASKVGSRQVHGRSAAGGQSQQRFARRRDNQVTVAQATAADNAVRVLLPAAPSLDVLVRGGERTSVDAVLADRRLAPLRPLVVDRFLDVPDPRQAVLESTPALYRALRVHVVQP